MSVRQSFHLSKFEPSDHDDEKPFIRAMNPVHSFSFTADTKFFSSTPNDGDDLDEILGRKKKSGQAGHELSSLVTAVNAAFDSKQYCTTADFEHEGCKWRTILAKPCSAAAQDPETQLNKNFWVYTALCEKESDGPNKLYTVEMALMPPKDSSRPISGDMRKRAKKMFNFVGYSVKKEIARLGFPEFPEGCSGRLFKKFYQLNKEINRGSYAVVFRGTHRKTGKVVAIKSVNRRALEPADDAALFNEVAIMANLHHENICGLIDFFEEPDWYLLVLDYMDGGDLFDKIGQKKTYSESDARNLCRQCLEAVNECHEHNVAHLDLKTKNLLLESNSIDACIKLADFGFAEQVSHPKSLNRQCGTPFFIAPEIIQNIPYDEQADMWSLGVIFYVLLGGDLPFMGTTMQELFKKICGGQYRFPDKYWHNVSAEAKDCVRNLLVPDPDKRWTAAQALECDWLAKDEHVLLAHDLNESFGSLKSFNGRMKMKAAMIAITVARRLQFEPLEGVQEEDSEESDLSEEEEEEEEDKAAALKAKFQGAVKRSQKSLTMIRSFNSIKNMKVDEKIERNKPMQDSPFM